MGQSEGWVRGGWRWGVGGVRAHLRLPPAWAPSGHRARAAELPAPAAAAWHQARAAAARGAVVGGHHRRWGAASGHHRRWGAASAGGGHLLQWVAASGARGRHRRWAAVPSRVAAAARRLSAAEPELVPSAAGPGGRQDVAAARGGRQGAGGAGPGGRRDVAAGAAAARRQRRAAAAAGWVAPRPAAAAAWAAPWGELWGPWGRRSRRPGRASSQALRRSCSRPVSAWGKGQGVSLGAWRAHASPNEGTISLAVSRTKGEHMLYYLPLPAR